MEAAEVKKEEGTVPSAPGKRAGRGRVVAVRYRRRSRSSALPRVLGIVRPAAVILRNLIRRPSTLLYPYEKLQMPEGFRGMHYLDLDKCTGCAACARACPNKCIYMVQIPGRSRKTIEVDEGHCMFCELCAEACPFDCLFFTRIYEHASFTREGLIYPPERLTETKNEEPTGAPCTDELWYRLFGDDVPPRYPDRPDWSGRRKNEISVWLKGGVPAPATAETQGEKKPAAAKPPPPPKGANAVPLVDKGTCTGCNACINTAGGVFAMGADGKAFVKNPKGDSVEDIHSALLGCPVNAISWKILPKGGGGG